jgi:hypothetical protein
MAKVANFRALFANYYHEGHGTKEKPTGYAFKKIFTD